MDKPRTLNRGFKSCAYLWCTQCHLVDMTLDAAKMNKTYEGSIKRTSSAYEMTFKMSLFQLSQTPQECDVVNMGVIINHTRRAAAITFSLRFCQHSLLHVLFANIWISLSL